MQVDGSVSGVSAIGKILHINFCVFDSKGSLHMACKPTLLSQGHRNAGARTLR